MIDPVAFDDLRVKLENVLVDAYMVGGEDEDDFLHPEFLALQSSIFAMQAKMCAVIGHVAQESPSDPGCCKWCAGSLTQTRDGAALRGRVVRG